MRRDCSIASASSPVVTYTGAPSSASGEQITTKKAPLLTAGPSQPVEGFAQVYDARRSMMHKAASLSASQSAGRAVPARAAAGSDGGSSARLLFVRRSAVALLNTTDSTPRAAKTLLGHSDHPDAVRRRSAGRRNFTSGNNHYRKQSPSC